ncbi:hypothetical protein SAMN05444266_106349 [Chitinophaga jiangningensis]|uniref:Uncharacterized protein n=1 Tax=Chitinophaga jiangningensis TaxID=1419482 RepID=A0A1M7FZZ5_9BACT|nr:hypothetical protein [Chitinophaga jiangningensis]SHM09674.1 hypothetical protein SAMN05444266_106349 [Chitinophaga jiangningensis]
MNPSALICAQCGSSDVSLMPERNDLVHCNHCGTLFMIPSSSENLPEKPVEDDDLEIPSRPAFARESGSKKLAVITVIVCAVIALFAGTTRDGDVKILLILCIFGLLGLLLIIGLSREAARRKEIENSPEMQEYNEKIKRVAAQLEERRRKRIDQKK